MFLFAAFAGIALASCTTDEEIFAPVNQGNEIEFVAANYVSQTRGGHGEATFSNENFAVYAWEEGTNKALMANVNVIQSGNSWKPESGTYYWPDNTFIDFTAISPSGNEAFTSVTRANDGSSSDIVVTFNDTYPNPTDVNLMFADTTKQKYVYPVNNTAPSAPAVPMLFRHLLAKLKVVVNQASVTPPAGIDSYVIKLTDLSFTGICDKGTLTVDNNYRTAAKGDNANTVWSSQEGSATWEIIKDTETELPYNTTENYYVMPQNITGAQKVVIEYDITTNFTSGTVTTSHKTRTIDLKDITTKVENWYTNKFITYTINISPADLAEITFTAEEEIWCEEVEGEENIK